MSAPLYDKCLEALEPFGFRPAPDSGDTKTIGRFSSGPPNIQGVCVPTELHLELVTSFEWISGPLVMISPHSAQPVIMETFFVLESPEIPESILSMRDHFDYGVEAQLRDRFGSFSPSIGPSWHYIYGCGGFLECLERDKLVLQTPLIGASLNCRSENPGQLPDALSRMKDFMQGILPLPFIWGFPESVTVGDKDYLRDVRHKKWYAARVDFMHGLALADIATADRKNPSFAQHRYNEGRILDVGADLDKLSVEFIQLGGKLRRKRKLKNLSIEIV